MPLASIIFLAFIQVAHGAAEATVNGSGTPAAAANPGAIIGQAYQFALLIGGLLAFGAIVYGGIKYTVSAGNPSGKSDGREWIYGALWGLLLLLGSYLILHTINPNLTNLNLPTLAKLQPPPAGVPAGCTGSACPSNACLSGNCAQLSETNIPCKSGATCTADPKMVSALKCLGNSFGSNISLQINEAYPPTVRHDDPKHYNGCAVDLVVKNYSGQADCSKVYSVLSAAPQCGLKPLNEYTQCSGKAFDTTTGQNIHLDGCN